MSVKPKNKTVYDSYYCYDNTIVFHFSLNPPDYWCENGPEEILKFVEQLNNVIQYYNENLKDRDNIGFRYAEDSGYIEISCIMTDKEHKEWMKTKKKEQQQEK